MSGSKKGPSALINVVKVAPVLEVRDILHAALEILDHLRKEEGKDAETYLYKQNHV